MRVLVTGGAGYIGSVLTRRLVDEGHEVTVLDRCFWGVEPLNPLLDRISLVREDVRAFDLSLLDRSDAVIHLAGLSNDPTAEYNPRANWEMNVEATARLADASAARGLRFLFGSSCSLYDGLGAEAPADESAVVEARGPYARSKWAAERHVLSRSDDWCPVIVRQATVYGYSPRLRLDLVVNTFVRDAVVRGELFLHGGGWMWRPLIGLENLADVYAALLGVEPALVRGEVFNAVEENYQIRHLAMLVAGSVQMFRPGLRVALTEVPAPARVRNYRVFGKKLQSALGLSYRHTMLEAIETLVHHVGGFSESELHEPRYTNIRWMTLLEQAVAAVDPGIDFWAAPSARPVTASA
jgi:nucleoside-diphosphate-sugar epimerase